MILVCRGYCWHVDAANEIEFNVQAQNQGEKESNTIFRHSCFIPPQPPGLQREFYLSRPRLEQTGAAFVMFSRERANVEEEPSLTIPLN